MEEAILLHGGEATTSKNKFSLLSSADKQALLKFLESL
ncbi:di-heme oxidoredictase family protein [Acinetobacter baumannii]